MQYDKQEIYNYLIEKIPIFNIYSSKKMLLSKCDLIAKVLNFRYIHTGKKYTLEQILFEYLDNGFKIFDNEEQEYMKYKHTKEYIISIAHDLIPYVTNNFKKSFNDECKCIVEYNSCENECVLRIYYRELIYVSQNIDCDIWVDKCIEFKDEIFENMLFKKISRIYLRMESLSDEEYDKIITNQTYSQSQY